MPWLAGLGGRLHPIKWRVGVRRPLTRVFLLFGGCKTGSLNCSISTPKKISLYLARVTGRVIASDPRPVYVSLGTAACTIPLAWNNWSILRLQGIATGAA